MKYILFLMFFVTPPAAPPKPGEKAVPKVWALQSTSTMEFVDENSCEEAYAEIAGSLEKTDTLNVVAWCMPQAIKSSKKETYSKPLAESDGSPAASRPRKLRPPK